MRLQDCLHHTCHVYLCDTYNWSTSPPSKIRDSVQVYIFSAKAKNFLMLLGSHWFPQIAYFVNCCLNYTPKHNLLFIKRKVNIAISMQNYIHSVSAYRQFYVWLSSYGQFRIAHKEDHPSEFLSLFSKQTFFFTSVGILTCVLLTTWIFVPFWSEEFLPIEHHVAISLSVAFCFSPVWGSSFNSSSSVVNICPSMIQPEVSEALSYWLDHIHPTVSPSPARDPRWLKNRRTGNIDWIHYDNLHTKFSSVLVKR